MFYASNGILAYVITAEEALKIYHAHEKSRTGSPTEGFTVWPVGEMGHLLKCAWTRVEPLAFVPAELLDAADWSRA